MVWVMGDSGQMGSASTVVGIWVELNFMCVVLMEGGCGFGGGRGGDVVGLIS